MATTVGQHGVAAFTNPSNGDALDANVVKGNDNTIRDAYVAHDSDPGIHIQSSLLAARPAAGTVGRKWMTTDTANVKLFYDNGSAWENLDYLPTAGNVAITGDLTVAGTTTLTGTVGLPSGTILTSPSLLGTMTGGTLTPSTINVPSGTTIPAPTLTGTTTAGVISATGNSTVTGNLNVTGTLTAGSISGPTTVAASNVTTGTFGAGNFTFPSNLTVSGTLAPVTLTVPSGTTIPTHTETGTITATGSTRNNGTISGATLTNSTFTGSVSGLLTSATLGTTITLGTSSTSIVSTTLPSTGNYLILASGYVGAAAGSAALERVAIDLSVASGGSVTQFVGVLGSSSANPIGYYVPFSIMLVVTSASGSCTLTGYKFASGNLCTVSSATIALIRIS
jgi:hypothetical protein